MRAIMAAVVVTAAAVAVDGWLLRNAGGTEILTPEPAKVVQMFVGSLAARRPAIAREHLAEESRARLSTARLSALARELRARHGTYRFEAGEARRAGHATEVHARIRTERAGTVERTFRLARDPATRL